MVIRQLITPDELATCSSHDLASQKKKDERKKTQSEAMASRRSDLLMEQLKNSGKSNGFFTCKCGSKNTFYY